MPLNNLRSFKCALFVAAVISLTSSCVTQRRCLQKYPPVPADTVTVTRWRDTTVYVIVEGSYINDSVTLAIPCPDSIKTIYIKPVTQPAKRDTAVAVSPWATSKAFYARGKIHLIQIVQKQRIAFVIDSAVRASTKTITEKVVVKERYVPPFYRATLFVSIVLFLLFVVIILIALRR